MFADDTALIPGAEGDMKASLKQMSALMQDKHNVTINKSNEVYSGGCSSSYIQIGWRNINISKGLCIFK